MSKRKHQLHLYVWPFFCPDYKNGLAFAIAQSAEHAKELIESRLGYEPSEWGDCIVLPCDQPVGFGVHGGM